MQLLNTSVLKLKQISHILHFGLIVTSSLINGTFFHPLMLGISQYTVFSPLAKNLCHHILLDWTSTFFSGKSALVCKLQAKAPT